ncbi:TPA: host cell division inhibitor Icd-like protein [Escherichia coli]|nr:host cell division inhibitor Icd-like protein [Escherichia coli]ELO6144650.1 host cell division inhibitor Icd-like protein [Escherichia coli]HBB8546008.1 host cell division inhibitor Icd-like protein [Escherichia coli]HBB8551247.1 host cell division inhibitor Icd-like protein [Escherichia coli]HBK0622256.1 host cell division inhibitor Icd-like protein [Escherichia coli]
MKKAAPIRNRLSEQLTCCEKNGSVQGNYINRVVKRHYCRITGKTKATAKGSPVGTRENKSITNNATFAAGGQSVRFTPMTLGLTEGHYGECAGLLVGYQPLGSIPRRFSSARPNSLSQLARLMPSLCASLSNCSFSSGEIRILNCGDCPSPLGLLSRLIVDKWSPIELAFLLLGGHLNTGTLKKAKPEGARNTNGLLTTNDNDSIEVAMRNYTRHPQGRDSYNLNKYIWRFIALSTAQPRVITIEATSEQEARQQSPDGCVMVFAARIRQGVHHVQ